MMTHVCLSKKSESKKSNGGSFPAGNSPALTRERDRKIAALTYRQRWLVAIHMSKDNQHYVACMQSQSFFRVELKYFDAKFSQHNALIIACRKTKTVIRCSTVCTASYRDKDPSWSKHVFLRFLNILSIPSIVLHAPVLKACDAAHYHHLLGNLCFTSFEQRMI